MTWEGGQSGNPGGHRPRKLFVDALHALISQDWVDNLPPTPRPLNGETVKVAHMMAYKLVKGALRDDWKPGEALDYMKELCDRAYGKPKQPLTGGDDDDRPLVPAKIEIVLVQAKD